ncbi:hypothetical protein [Comamonas sp. GB3 AK4-5]|uniref:hypothetical protein n=1 Tax=Comamonas sp. GB3 AK4-5 TaxID=3231487 RepID=UPI00351ED197
MSSEPQKLPVNFWRSRRKELTIMAKTMTAEQIAMHFGSTTKRVRDSLSALQITPAQAFVPLHVGREHQLREMAKTMTFTEIAKAMGTPPNTMYSMLSRLKIKALAKSLTPTLQDRLEELTRLAPTMSLEQLGKHFDRAPKTIQKEIYKLGMRPLTTHQSLWSARADELRAMAKTMNPTELAKHYGSTRNNMYRILQRLGIQCQQQPATATAKAAPSKPKPAPTKLTRLESRPATVPRSTAARKAPVQIVMPAGLKVTHIELQLPTSARICNGTSREPYRPHSDVIAVARGTAYGRLLEAQHAARQ